MTVAWSEVARLLRARCDLEERRSSDEQRLDAEQRASLGWMANRLPAHGVVLADEVGTGKTRIACAIVHAVVAAGGRAAVVVPHGLMHQWKRESALLGEGAPEPKVFTTLTDLFRDVRTEADIAAWHARAPAPDEPEWCLFSHGFRAPIVRSGARDWRYALPPFAELHLQTEEDAADARTRWGKLKREIDKVRDHATEWGWNGMARIAEAAAPRVRRDRGLRHRLAQLPAINASTWENSALIDAFANDGEGRLCTEAILGHWLGEFDLLVIDEAHKGRGEIERDESEKERAGRGSVLAQLVERLIRTTSDARRVCLTATPMELDLSQWLNLLERARCGLDVDRGRAVVEHLRSATTGAATAPDEGPRLDALCTAAQQFARTLAPYVTRRRRATDALVAAFAGRVHGREGRAHVHRRVERKVVPWSGDETARSPWVDVLFAAECMSQSMRGLPREVTAEWPRAVQDAYTKLAAGHVSIDLVDTEEPIRLPEAGAVDEVTRGKVARTAYWYRQLRAARRGVHGGTISDVGDFDPEAEHPRVLAAVSEIESWTTSSSPEKVLVFGVFLKPLFHLRDVLNVRHVLRLADAGRPIPRAIEQEPALVAIARRQLTRMQECGAVVGQLGAASWNDVVRVLRVGNDEYTRVRRQVHDRSKKIVDHWLHDAAVLGGEASDAALATGLRDEFVAFAMDHILADRDGGSAREALDGLAAEFVAERLRPFLGEGDQDDSEKASSDRVAELRRALEDEDSRQSSYARLLHGGTRWETRRYLQAAFNRAKASPWVLIAQSQVGREGLNLHEQCRVVLQFHAEWNPAVLEQQIGRVDRKGSLWERRAKEWLDGRTVGEPPFIEVRQLVFEGTYDAFQWSRVGRRQQAFDASLFGTLLPAESWDRVPEEHRAKLVAAAPSFSPVQGGARPARPPQ
jgi:hypothetical protein